MAQIRRSKCVRLARYYAVLFASGLFLFSASIYSVFQYSVREQFDARLGREAHEVTRSLLAHTQGSLAITEAWCREEATAFHEMNGHEVLVLSRNGRILFRSDGDSSMDNISPAMPTSEVEATWSEEMSPTDREDIRFSCDPIIKNGKCLGWSVVGASTAPLSTSTSALLNSILIAGIMLMVFGGVAAYAGARRPLHPLERMASEMREILRGEKRPSHLSPTRDSEIAVGELLEEA